MARLTNGARLLRLWRTERDMTQAQLAELLQVSYEQVSRAETGYHLPSLLLAVRISRVTGGRVPEESWAQEDAA